MKHLISLNDLTTDEIIDLLDLADRLKADFGPGAASHPAGQDLRDDLYQILNPHPGVL
jgi:ornithine carbamoyltransferase